MELNRRSFLKGLGLLIGGVALEEAIPLGRVWSFPTEIVIPSGNQLLTVDWITKESLKILEKNMKFNPFVLRPYFNYGSVLEIRKPGRYTVEDIRSKQSSS